jgi:hypothetical protein
MSYAPKQTKPGRVQEEQKQVNIPDKTIVTDRMKTSEELETLRIQKSEESNEMILDDKDKKTKKQTDYEKYLIEAVNKLLTIGFGRPAGLSYIVEGDEKYDMAYWDVAMDATNNSATLMLKSGVLPSLAIEEIFNHPERWNIDCSRFVQLPHLYALLHTMGEKNFNKKYGGKLFFLQPHNSTGIESGINYMRLTPDDPFRKGDPETGPIESRSLEELLKVAPVGTRIGYRAISHIENDFVFENAIKVGDDKYGAHFPNQKKNIYTNEELKLRIAEFFISSKDYPSQKEYDNALRLFADDYVFITAIQPLNKKRVSK